MGVGLNTGHVMSGNVGSKRRLEYTAIGDTTNTAARLEGMTKGTPHQLFVADSTRCALTREPEEPLVEVGELPIRGRTRPVSIWTLCSLDKPHPSGGGQKEPGISEQADDEAEGRAFTER